jgi:HD-GYP domain-containing protein (c-di-GMP phosphodiesterase class II)
MTVNETRPSRVTRFTHELVVGLLNLELHHPRSQIVRDSLQNITYELSAMFATNCPDPVVISIGDNCLFHQGELLIGSSLQARRLIGLCAERGIKALRFDSRVTADELLGFLTLLAAPDKIADFQPGRAHEVLHFCGVHHVDVDFALAEETVNTEGPAGVTADAMKQYQALADCLQESHVAAFRGEELEIEKACGIVEAALSQVDAPAGLLALASQDFIDSFTVGHSVRVALLALQVASVGGASRPDLIRVGTAGLLHDIGKSRIPQEILFKRGRLTDEERAIMCQHPRLGGEVLLEQPQLDPATIGAAFCHHMSPGGGYPDPALPFEPSGISKLVRVCDVFEALTSVRPYKTAMSPLEAYAVMFRDAGAFDPDWLRFFVQALGIYPQGTYLALDTGEVALVVGQGENPTRPLVQVVTDAGGNAVPEGTGDCFTIGEAVDGVVHRVRETQPGDGSVSPQSPPAMVREPDRHQHEPGEGAHEPGDGAAAGIRGCCGEDLVVPRTPG